MKALQFANLPLRRKIQAVILLTAAVLTAVMLAGAQAVQAVNSRLLSDAIADSLSCVSGELEDALSAAEDLSYLILSDQSIQQSLSQIADTSDAYQYRGDYRQLHGQLSSYQLQFSGTAFAADLILYTGRYEVRALGETEALPYTVSLSLRRAALAGGGAPVWVTDFSDEYGVFLVRELRSSFDFSLDSLGVLAVRVDMDALVSHAFRFLKDRQTGALLSDGPSTLYASDGLTTDDISLLTHTDSTSAYRILPLSSSRFFLAQKTLPRHGWKVTVLIDYAPVRQTLSAARLAYLLAVLLALLFSLFLGARLSASITVHFQSLIEKMHAFEADSSSVPESPFDYARRSDEVATLHKQFDRMAERVRTLIEQNYVLELLQRDARIKALETQIDPHFLYNTLESLNWRAKTSGQTQISQMAEALGAVLRVSLGKSSGHFTLGQELALVDNYMTIQRLRYPRRLTYENQVNTCLHPARLPRLTLQPLVENAIRYALEENPEQCRIEIAAGLDSGTLRITVRNTGSNFAEDFMERFQRGTLETHGFGVGLQNIDSRLRLTFGSGCGLSFENDGDWAVVRIVIPFETIGGDSNAENADSGR